ncbi:MAG: hypothetical protein ACFFEE_04760 [Candidatus Thorarchaeota archaeon]
MKESGRCPKCESSNIWDSIAVTKKGPVISRKWVMVVSAFWPRNRKYAFKDEYVCVDCGYSETFVDEEGLRIIKEYGFSYLE